jgi:hypothetical protein
MTAHGGKRAHVRKFEPTTPDKTAPVRNALQTLASISARVSENLLGPAPHPEVFAPAAEARWPPILFKVPVTKVRLTDSAPILAKAGFVMPIDKESNAIVK